jgi:Divalent cation transporter
MWRFKIDPDTAAIPYLTSLGDLIGSSLLFGAFAFLRAVGHDYKGRETSRASELLAVPIEYVLRVMSQET